jgi:hypothetical protein
MYRTLKPHTHHLRDAARNVAVRLVYLRLQHCRMCRVSTQITGRPSTHNSSAMNKPQADYPI